MQVIIQPNQEYIKTRSALVGAFALVMVLLVAVSSSWGACKSLTSVARGGWTCYGISSEGVTGNTAYCGWGKDYPYSNANAVATNGPYCSNYSVYCDGFVCSTQAEADSVRCANNPDSLWVGSAASGYCKSSKCDANSWTCSTESRIEQVGSSGGNEITCINGQCFGLPTCSYKSIAKTTCRNECGDITEQEAETPAFIYEGACDDKLLTPEDCSRTKCVTSHKTGNYILYKVCGSGKVGNDGEQLLPQITQTGKGSCSSLGYPEEPLGGSSSSAGNLDSASYSQECLLYGVGCPASVDSVDFSKGENRTAANGCKCEPYDGISAMSRVVCPDGSTSVNFFSCDDFNKSSSSSAESSPSSSSSGSEEGGGSSSALVGDWVTYSQGEDIKSGLAVIADGIEQNNSLTATGNGLISRVLESLNSTGSASFTAEDYVLSDSSNYGDYIDTTKKSLLDSILSSIDTINTMVDTLTISSTGKCPCLTFDLETIPYIGRSFKIDFKSFWGVNLCSVISTIVMGLASVVSFFLGIGLFIWAKKE